jgi:DNA-binding MarR family transcriptional regulator
MAFAGAPVPDDLDSCEADRPKAPDQLDPVLYESLARFRFALRQFLAFSESTTAMAGVTPQQYQALLVIQTHPGRGMMIRDFANQMLLQHHGGVQLLNRLAAAGLIERRRSGTDRRSVLVLMTGKGSALLKHLASAHINELLKQEPLLAESLRRLRRIGL